MNDLNCLRAWLRKRPISIRQVALRARVSRETVYRIMRNGNKTRQDILTRVWNVMEEEKKKTARP